jgi:hypothetical protein
MLLSLASSCLVAVLGSMTSPESDQIDGSFITSVHLTSLCLAIVRPRKGHGLVDEIASRSCKEGICIMNFIL